MDSQVFLAHGEAHNAGGEGEDQENADGHMIHHCLDSAEAEVRRADRGDQDDGQRRATQQPAFDQQAFERLVVELIDPGTSVTSFPRSPATLLRT